MARAEREIKEMLYQAGIMSFVGEYVEKEYVFELEGVYRERRPYYRVRYPFGKESKEEVRADW